MNQNMSKHINLIITIASISLIAGVALAIKMENVEYIKFVTPQTTPPVASCDAASEGVTYYNSQDDTTYVCDGAGNWMSSGATGDISPTTVIITGGQLYMNDPGEEGNINRVNYIYGRDDLQLWAQDPLNDTATIYLHGDGGITDPPYITFYTQATERMRIDATGNISIATGGSFTITDLQSCDAVYTDTNGILTCGGSAANNQVWKKDGSGILGWSDEPTGGATISGTPAAGQVAFFSSASSITSDSNFSWDDTNNKLTATGTINVLGPNTQGVLLEPGLNNPNFSDIAFYNGAFKTGRIDAATLALQSRVTGNVGIGTANPGAKLDVNGQIYVHEGSVGGLTLEGRNAWSSRLLANAYYNGSSEVYRTTGRGAFKIDVYHDGDTSPQYIAFYGANQGTADNTITWNTVGLAMDEDGNVGIGTTVPDQKLDVVGKVRIGEAASGRDEGILLSAGGADANAWGRIFFEENSADTYGFSVVYNGDVANAVLNYPTNTFGISRHEGTAIGEIALSILRSTGNVGIGTTGPQQQLDVAGPVTVRGNALYFDSNNCSTGTTCNFIRGNLASNGTKAGTYNMLQIESRFDDIVIQAGINDSNRRQITLRSGDNNVGLVVDANGNVGIGNTSPGAKLDVEGNARFDYSGGYTTINDTSGVQVYNSESTSGQIRLGAAWNKPGVYSSGPLYLFSDTTGVYIGDSNSEDMFVRADGNVGIGTMSPAYKLDVNGSIRATGDIIGNQIYQQKVTRNLQFASWYKFADSAGGAGNNAGIFEIRWSRSSYHGHVRFSVGANYGSDTRRSVKILDSSSYETGTPQISNIRLRMSSTYDQMFIEFYYNDYGGDTAVEVYKYQAYGWNLVSITAAVSLSGYSNYYSPVMEQYYSVPLSCDVSSGTRLGFLGSWVGGTSGSKTFVCPVNLPHNAVVAAAVCLGSDSANSWYLRRGNMSSSGEATMASGAHNTTDSSISYSTIDNFSYQYFIDATLGAYDYLWGCRITYHY